MFQPTVFSAEETVKQVRWRDALLNAGAALEALLCNDGKRLVGALRLFKDVAHLIIGKLRICRPDQG